MSVIVVFKYLNNYLVEKELNMPCCGSRAQNYNHWVKSKGGKSLTQNDKEIANKKCKNKSNRPWR